MLPALHPLCVKLCSRMNNHRAHRLVFYTIRGHVVIVGHSDGYSHVALHRRQDEHGGRAPTLDEFRLLNLQRRPRRGATSCCARRQRTVDHQSKPGANQIFCADFVFLSRPFRSANEPFAIVASPPPPSPSPSPPPPK